MRRKIIVLIALLWPAQFLYAQKDCNCDSALTKLISIVEKDYPGFKEKTQNKIVYQSFKADLLAKAAINKQECIPLLKDYISYFRDSHIFFADESNSITPNKIKKKEIVKLDLKLFIKNISKTKDPMEGIWENEEFKIGILKTGPELYQGFIITSKNDSWKPNEVLFTLDKQQKLKYYNNNLTYYEDKYSLVNDSTFSLLKTRKYFVKNNQQLLDSLQVSERIGRLSGFYIERVTPKTTLIKLKSFDYPFVARIEKLIADHKELIENSENLIIDLTDNGGGTTSAYGPLMPYILTGSTRHLGTEYLATDFLIEGLTTYIKTLADTDKNRTDIERINQNIKLYKENLGQFVLNTGEQKIQVSTIDLALKSPKQVVFLVNKNVGSAAENLLLTAKQSKKVKIMGTPTFGVLDYASARLTNFECNGSTLVLPTNRSGRLPDYPIDNIGVQPDIYLDKSVENWIEYAIKYIEN